MMTIIRRSLGAIRRAIALRRFAAVLCAACALDTRIETVRRDRSDIVRYRLMSVG